MTKPRPEGNRESLQPSPEKQGVSPIEERGRQAEALGRNINVEEKKVNNFSVVDESGKSHEIKVSNPTYLESLTGAKNLRGGAPGRTHGAKRNIESTEQAVDDIFKAFEQQTGQPLKTVITFEENSDSGFTNQIKKSEIAKWKAHGVEVIEMPVGEEEIAKLFFGANPKLLSKGRGKYPDISGYFGDTLSKHLKLDPRVLKAFEALDAGGAFIHCTFGMHRAVAFTEIWRAWRGLDRRAKLYKNKNFDTSRGHRECRKQADKIIETFLYKKTGTITAPKELLEGLERNAGLESEVDKAERAAWHAKAAEKIKAPQLPVLNDIISKRRVAKFGYVSNMTRIEGGNYRGGSPGILGKKNHTVDQVNKSVDILATTLNPKIRTVIILNSEQHKAEAAAWKRHGVKVIYMHTYTEVFEDFEKKYPEKMWEGFKALNEGGTFVHCKHGSHRAVAYTELWRATRGIDRTKAMRENRSYNGGQRQMRENTKNLIPRYLADSRGKNGLTGTYAGQIGNELAAGAGFGGTGFENMNLPAAFTTTEHESKESNSLQEAIQKELYNISAEARIEDEKKLQEASIKDIRFNMDLLNEKSTEVHTEMIHRLGQYTTPQEDGGLRINYEKFNRSGADHEMGIGLGDILPPKYSRVVIVTSSGSHKIGVRKIVTTSSGESRVGYADEKSGGYLATYTGDVVYVVDPPLTDEAELKARLAEEKAAREAGKTSYRQTSSTNLSYAPSHVPFYDESDYEGEANLPENANLQQKAINGLNRKIEGRKFWDYSRIKIKAGGVEWEYNPNTSEGENIYEYSRAVCRHHNMEGDLSIIWAIVSAETGGSFNPFSKNDHSAATGLGQPMAEGTWKGFIGGALKSRDPFIQKMLEGQKYKGIEYPNSGDRSPEGRRRAMITVNLSTNPFPKSRDFLNYSRCNPYLNIYHTIMFTKNCKKSYKNRAGIDVDKLNAYERARLLYLSHHDGPGGGPSMVKFLAHLKKKEGVNINDREEVIAFITNGTPAAKRALSILAKRQGPRVLRRALSTDPDVRASCMRSWYRTCIKVADAATGGIGKSSRTASKNTEQQPLQIGISLANPKILESIRTMPTDYKPDGILALGNKDDNESRERAEYAAEWALKTGAAFITTGGKVGRFNKKHGISEGQRAMAHIYSIPKYRPLFQNPTRPHGIEDASRNTQENMANSARYLVKQGYKKILIVSWEDKENHAKRGARNLAKALNNLGPAGAGIEIRFYEPDQPNIAKSVYYTTGKRSKGAPKESAPKTSASFQPSESPDIDKNVSPEKLEPKLSTTELLQIFRSGNKEEIDRIIAQHGYPSLESIEKQLKNTPAGKFREDPEGVLRNIDATNKKILLTFDICSNYKGQGEKNALEFIDNIASKTPPVPVILFVTGNALSNPRIRKAIEKAARYEHISIQNHGYSHNPLGTAQGLTKPYGITPTSSIEEAYYEVVKGSILTQSITGQKPKFYRSSTLYADPRGVKLAGMLGLKTLGRTTDGDHQEIGAEKPGNIVLRHAIKTTSVAFIENMRARIQKGEINPVV